HASNANVVKSNVSRMARIIWNRRSGHATLSPWKKEWNHSQLICQTPYRMPSFDIVSEVDSQEVDNALNQARKELATRFDFKGSAALILYEKDQITLTAEDAGRLRGLREIVIGKLSKRGVDLRNINQGEPNISPLGHARQEL